VQTFRKEREKRGLAFLRRGGEPSADAPHDLRREIECGNDGHGQQREFPASGEERNGGGRERRHVGCDTYEGGRGHALDGVHVVVDPRDDLSGSRARVEAERHALQVAEERVAEVKHDPLAGARGERLFEHADQPAGEGQSDHGPRKQAEQSEVFVRDRSVQDQRNAKRGQHVQPRGNDDAQQDQAPLEPIRTKIFADPLQAGPVDLRGATVEAFLREVPVQPVGPGQAAGCGHHPSPDAAHHLPSLRLRRNSRRSLVRSRTSVRFSSSVRQLVSSEISSA